MKQALLTKVIMGILLALNLSLLAFVFMQSQAPKEPRREGQNRREPVPEAIAKILSFTQEQKEAYRKLGRKHHEGLMDIERDLGTSLLNYFSMKSKGVPAEISDEILTKILEKEKEKLLYTQQHFEDIKNICTEEQFEKFPEVLEILFKRLNKGNNRAGRPRRPGGPGRPDRPDGPDGPPGRKPSP